MTQVGMGRRGIVPLHMKRHTTHTTHTDAPPLCSVSIGAYMLVWFAEEVTKSCHSCQILSPPYHLIAKRGLVAINKNTSRQQVQGIVAGRTANKNKNPTTFSFGFGSFFFRRAVFVLKIIIKFLPEELKCQV